MKILTIIGALQLALEDVHVDSAPFVQQTAQAVTEVEIKQCVPEYEPLRMTFHRRGKGEKRRNRSDRWGQGSRR